MKNKLRKILAVMMAMALSVPSPVYGEEIISGEAAEEYGETAEWEEEQTLSPEYGEFSDEEEQETVAEPVPESTAEIPAETETAALPAGEAVLEELSDGVSSGTDSAAPAVGEASPAESVLASETGAYKIEFLYEGRSFLTAGDIPYTADVAEILKAIGIEGSLDYAYADPYEGFFDMVIDYEGSSYILKLDQPVSIEGGVPFTATVVTDDGSTDYTVWVKTTINTPEPEPEEEQDPVSYIEENGEAAECKEYVVIDQDVNLEKASANWYVLKQSYTAGSGMTVEGDVNLVLCDGAELSVSGLSVTSGSRLSIYRQEGGSGALTVSGGMITNSGNLFQYGGTISASSDGIANNGMMSVNGTVILDGTEGIVNTGSLTLEENGSIGGNVRYELIRTSGTLNLNGGQISGTNSDANAVVVAGGSTVLCGTEISGSFSGGLVLSGGNAVMNGGQISGCASGVRVSAGSFSMSGGTISRNSSYGVLVTSTGSSGTSGGSFAMTGGTVTGNTGAGVRVEGNGSVSMSGMPVVADNGGAGSQDVGVYLSKEKYINVSGAFAEGTRIGVKSDDTLTVQPFTSGYEKHNGKTDPAEYFYSTEGMRSNNKREREVGSEVNKGEAVLIDTRAVPYVTPEGDILWKGEFSYAHGVSGNTFGNGWYVVSQDTVFSKRINIIGDVNLILCDGATLTCNDGIFVPKRCSSSLTIWAQEKGTGKLVAHASDYWAGIGGNAGATENSGKITINGGVIDAIGGTRAAGIGGGQYSSHDTIRILKGTVIAQGGTHAAGIGGGEDSDNGAVYISGGIVKATGGDYGAGIGGGEGGSQSQLVIISGGTVTATGGIRGAGIGGGEHYGGGGNCGTVQISGGTVIATGREEGDAIGAGQGGEITGAILLYDSAKVYFMSAEGLRYAVVQKTGSSVNDERIPACRQDYAEIRPCEHKEAAYRCDPDDPVRHFITCKYCKSYQDQAQNHSFDENGKCVCGYTLHKLIWDDADTAAQEKGTVSFSSDEAGEQKITMAGKGTDVYVKLVPAERQQILPEDLQFYYYEDSSQNKTELKDAELVSSDEKTGIYLYKLTMPDHDLHVTAEFTEKVYRISLICDQELGNVYSLPTSAAEDAKLQVEVQILKSAYIISAVKVVRDDNGSEVGITGNTFIMPGADVTVEIIFKTAWQDLQDRISNASAQEEIILTHNVTAQPEDHALLVASGKSVVIDLNSYRLDRDMTGAAENGFAFRVDGDLTVKDEAGGGRITGGNNSGAGGGVYVSSTGSLKLEGGSITGNSAEYGGGVYVDGEFSVSGNPVITGNTASSEGNNVLLGKNSLIRVSGGLWDEAKIGVSSEQCTTGGPAEIPVTEGLSGKGDVDQFETDARNYEIGKNASGEAVLVRGAVLNFYNDVAGTEIYKTCPEHIGNSLAGYSSETVYKEQSGDMSRGDLNSF